MNKEIFLHQLRIRLAQLPEEEIQKRLDYYAELIDDMTEDGISEEEAVASFGDVNRVAQSIMQEVPLATLMKTKVKPKNGWSTAAIVFAVIGAPIWIPLLIAFIAVIASVYLCIWAVIVCIFAVVVSLGAVGIYLIFRMCFLLVSGIGNGLLTLGAGLFLVGLCILAFLGAKVFVVELLKGTGWFARQIKNLFIKKEVE